jgi:hypothetical protein
MTDAPRFCVNCRHHVVVLGTIGRLWWKRDTLDHRCTAFAEKSTSPVTGNVTVFAAELPCDVGRESPRICGPEGTKWEAKP